MLGKRQNERVGNWNRGGYRRGTSSRWTGQTTHKKNVNPTGNDGRTLICKSCGSFRHVIANCPDSWDNLAKVNIAEEEEHVVLFTGYQKEEIVRLGDDAVLFWIAPVVIQHVVVTGPIVTLSR